MTAAAKDRHADGHVDEARGFDHARGGGLLRHSGAGPAPAAPATPDSATPCPFSA